MKKILFTFALLAMLSVTVVPQAWATKDGNGKEEQTETVTPAPSSKRICPALGVYGDPTLDTIHARLELHGYAPSNLRYGGEKDVCKYRVLGFRFGCEKMKVYPFSQFAMDNNGLRQENLEACSPDGNRLYVRVEKE